jgi:head-tail adaptor
MQPGRLDRRVTVQTLVPIQSATGQEVATWVDTFTTWAQVSPVGASERFATEQDLAEETSRFKFWWRQDWVPSPGKHRFAYPSSPAGSRRYWDVTGIAELGRHEGWEITATVHGVP